MRDDHVFWRLDSLSSKQVLAGLRRTLGSNRRLTAELVAHLGEVEERRLHLRAACSSMFNYCVSRLGLSEDEACRRIEVARLARRFPAIFPLLATGQLSLSVTALLKPYLSNDNVDGLLAAVSGKSVQLAREALATRFPRPDVPATVRQLPGVRRPPVEDTSALPLQLPGFASTLSIPQRPPASGVVRTLPTDTCRSMAGEVPSFVAPSSSPAATLPAPPATASAAATSPASSIAGHHRDKPPTAEQKRPAPVKPAFTETDHPGGGAPCSATHAQSHARAFPRAPSIEPLAAARYKVQFTADADLKAKLDLARDLMRHAVPSGDLAAIMSQALDRLIADLMKQRFGARSKKVESKASRKPGGLRQRGPSTAQTPKREVPAPATAEAAFTPAPAPPIPRAVRRAVAERDGLRCSWTDERGTRCEQRAWLEYDHRHPRAKGGASDADNVRLLCRSHNRHAAELEYGRAHVERAIVDARRRKVRPSAELVLAERDGQKHADGSAESWAEIGCSGSVERGLVDLDCRSATVQSCARPR